jgi:membrane protease subunit (stomatin/prohibitin family)
VFRLDVIDFFDHSNQVLAARVPESGSAAIYYGAQLIVQENQEAVFFRSGRAMDSFGPGRHTLTTENIPILTSILTIPWKKSPFQACVYFVAKHMFTDQPWGTRQPITVRDADFGIVRLRGFGKFSFRVTDPALLLNTVVGTQGRLTTREIGDYLKDLILSGLTDLLATSKISMLDLPSKFDEISAMARVKLSEKFNQLGLELNQFVVTSISPPEEVQKAIDARSSMAAIGDLQSYTLYQAANGMASMGEGGQGGNSGVGIGLGAGMGMMIPSILQQAMQQNAAVSKQAAGSQTAPRSLDFSSLKPTADEATPRQMIQKLAIDSGWTILEDSETSTQLEITISAVRKQRVSIDYTPADANGNPIVAIWSSCGIADPANAMLLLRYNNSIVQGAFALHRYNGQEHLVLKSNLLAGTTNPLELSRIVSAIAWQADQVEQDTTGDDVY